MDRGKVYLDPVHVTKAHGGLQAYPNIFLISTPDEMLILTAWPLCPQQKGFCCLFSRRSGGSESRPWGFSIGQKCRLCELQKQPEPHSL